MYVSNNRQREITTSNTDSINVDYISDIDYCYYTNIKFYDAQQTDRQTDRQTLKKLVVNVNHVPVIDQV